MKKTFTTIALLAVLGTMAVSCQKENIIDETFVTTEKSTVYIVSYTIDGVAHQVTLTGDDAWHDFLHHMLALAEEGHAVSFRNESAASRDAAHKETVTYTTTSHDDACSWADKMANNGYTVTVLYNEDEGVYICVATK